MKLELAVVSFAFLCLIVAVIAALVIQSGLVSLTGAL